MGTDDEGSGGSGRGRGWVWKALVLFGGVILIKKLGKSTTRHDHARIVAESLSGDKVFVCLLGIAILVCPRGVTDVLCFVLILKFSREQANRDPVNYFNLRMHACPVTAMVDGSRVLYCEQAFWRTPQKPFRQRFYMVKPCPKEMKCDVEVSSYAIRDVEEYRNFCDRSKDQRPKEEEALADMAEHLTTIHLSRCERGKRCLYEGSTAPEGFPNNWNGASFSTSQMAVYRNGEIHTWDRGYDEDGNQVWGGKEGPYKFKPVPVPTSGFSDLFPSLNLPSMTSLERKVDGAHVVRE